MPTDEALLAKILAEPATLQIAESLGLEPTESPSASCFT